jgi:hypothetical protein
MLQKVGKQQFFGYKLICKKKNQQGCQQNLQTSNWFATMKKWVINHFFCYRFICNKIINYCLKKSKDPTIKKYVCRILKNMVIGKFEETENYNEHPKKSCNI